MMAQVGVRVFKIALLGLVAVYLAGILWAFMSQWRADASEAKTPVIMRCDSHKAFIVVAADDGKLFKVRVPDFDKSACGGKR